MEYLGYFHGTTCDFKIKGGGGSRGIAQLVERRSPKPKVPGSSPGAPATFPCAGQPAELTGKI